MILFPHSYMPESILRKVRILFGKLTICQPYFMESSALPGEDSTLGPVRLINPPAELKPNKGFREILSEYRHWIAQNRDRSFREIIRADQPEKITEDSTWEIRQMLGRVVQSISSPKEDNALRWHLLLHLAREIENRRLEADKILKGLKETPPLLEGSVEDLLDIKGFLGDLPLFEPEMVLDESNLFQLLEAWFGLFGGCLKEDELLITYDKHVMGYISDQCDDLYVGDQSTSSVTIRFMIPDPALGVRDEQTESFEGYIDDDRFKEIKRLILGIGENPVEDLAALDRLSKEIENSSPSGQAGETFNIILRYLPSVPEERLPKSGSILRELFHKTVILVSEGVGHG